MSIQLKRFIYPLLLHVIIFMLGACQTVPPSSADLSAVDQTANHSAQQQKVFNHPKTQDEIRQAYRDYLNSASVNEKSRIAALTRLAELEYRSVNKILNQQQDAEASSDESKQEVLYQQRLNKTIELLNTSLEDYPRAKNNDALLYQLAKAQAQNNLVSDSIESLIKLTEQYPSSPYYVEAQFRIAEHAFVQQDYSSAEYAYTEVIVSAGNDIFYEKSLFKRGWSRFKQQFYDEAVDDFLQAVLHHEFDEFEKLAGAEREQFDEYFRAIGLSFSYLGGAESLQHYFKDRPDFKYTYFTYSMVADLYLKQERFSDAVATHEQFIKNFPDSDNIPYSHLKIIEIWKQGGFTKKIYQAIENFYSQYNASSRYWQDQNENSRVNRVIRRSLKEYVILMAGYYHNRYQTLGKTEEREQAEKWYQRYFKHYEAYARQDNIYYLYAGLKSQNKEQEQAFKYYELAAFDNALILHKDAAYAALLSSNELIKKSPANLPLIQKHIQYAINYSQQFSNEKRTQAITLNAAELAFKQKDYKSTIELVDLLPSNGMNIPSGYTTSLKADAYYQLAEYAETETLYKNLLANTSLNKKQQKEYKNKLALAIYKQGERAQNSQKFKQAISHYARISIQVPKTGVAATGLYDAIALNMQNKQWNDAISLIKRFQKLYPAHKFSNDVSKKLSVAYLGSNQGIKAAQAFEKIAREDSNIKIKAAALWQAAELYQEKQKVEDAIRSYKDYIRKFKKPYDQSIEAMHRISQLYLSTGNQKNSDFWLNKMIEADRNALNNVKTDRTKRLVSSSLLSLARAEKKRFDRIALTLPLQKSLRQKKDAMQKSVKLYGQASVYKIYEIATESTHSIALIYKDFSKALLNSDRPKNLSDEELDQYEILLEDQAFPFEDKSIEFFEINLARIKDGLFNKWIKASHQQLIELFPVRYDRKPKIDTYITEIN